MRLGLRRKVSAVRPGSWQAYGLAVPLTAVALVIRLALFEELDGGMAYVIFIVPVALSGIVGGVGPALFATALSFLGVWYFVLTPNHSFAIRSTAEGLQAFLFVTTGIIVSVGVEVLHRARRQTDFAVSQQLLSQSALAIAEERMRFALGAAKIGIWDMDFRTDVLEWSDVLEQQYGFQPGSFPGTFAAFTERIHPLDRSEVVQKIGDHMTAGGDFTVTHRTLWRDGTVRWLSGAGRIYLDKDGAAFRGVGVSRDVTEQRFADERTQEGQRMEAIGRLASGVAHDFNNLLTVILGFAGLIAADSAVKSQHGGDVDEIIKAAQRAAGLTSQLLAFSRQQAMNIGALDLNALITGMTGMLTRLIGEDIDVSLSLSPELDLALADKGQIEQVVMNLVVNARDAMPKGGRLRLTTANAHLENSSFHDHLVEAGDYVMFSVTDSGEGMTRETQRRVFEPFFTTKQAGHGTGLGLSTSYGIVKQSNGYIWVYSEPGLGATFKVYLPRATKPSTSISVHHTPSRAHQSVTETLLLVEDEGGVREFSRRTLVDFGYNVLQAANGDDAEKVFAEHGDAIDLVITDVVMPGCGGPELLKRLWLTSPGLKVLYMSGYTDQAAVIALDVTGHWRFLQKPFTASELLRHVRDALDRDEMGAPSSYIPAPLDPEV